MSKKKNSPSRRNVTPPSTDPLSISDLTANAHNPRLPWGEQQKILFRQSLNEFGDLSGIVLNRRSGQLVGGHKRVEEFKEDAGSTLHVSERLAKPDTAGTLAYGHAIMSSGVRFAYREVDWPVAKEKAAMLAANKWSAEWDTSLLGGILDDLQASAGELGFNLDVTGFFGALPNLEDSDADDEENGGGIDDVGGYSKKITAPTYTPTGECPPIAELISCEKVKQLQQEIEQAKLSDPALKNFLHLAALRHNVFDYEKIANYYAHAPKKIQRLMESSALVIIDFKQAVEKGYVLLTERMQKLYKLDKQKKDAATQND